MLVTVTQSVSEEEFVPFSGGRFFPILDHLLFNLFFSHSTCSGTGLSQAVWVCGYPNMDTRSPECTVMQRC